MDDTRNCELIYYTVPWVISYNYNMYNVLCVWENPQETTDLCERNCATSYIMGTVVSIHFDAEMPNYWPNVNVPCFLQKQFSA